MRAASGCDQKAFGTERRIDHRDEDSLIILVDGDAEVAALQFSDAIIADLLEFVPLI